jgi:hypothetical protein
MWTFIGSLPLPPPSEGGREWRSDLSGPRLEDPTAKPSPYAASSSGDDASSLPESIGKADRWGNWRACIKGHNSPKCVINRGLGKRRHNRIAGRSWMEAIFGKIAPEMTRAAAQGRAVIGKMAAIGGAILFQPAVQR